MAYSSKESINNCESGIVVSGQCRELVDEIYSYSGREDQELEVGLAQKFLKFSSSAISSSKVPHLESSITSPNSTID